MLRFSSSVPIFSGIQVIVSIFVFYFVLGGGKKCKKRPIVLKSVKKIQKKLRKSCRDFNAKLVFDKTNFFFWCNSITNNCRYFKYSPNVYKTIFHIYYAVAYYIN